MLALFHTAVDRLCGFLRRSDADAGFDEELHTHLAMAVQDKIKRGMSPDEARRTAHVELGGVTQLREVARAARGLPWLDGFGLDLKLGLRMLRKSWGLTLVGGFAMAVTIGLGASVFTIYQALTGTTLPLDEGDRVVAIQRFDAATTGNRSTPLPDFARWRDALQSVIRGHLPWFLINLGLAQKGDDCESVGAEHHWYNINGKTSGCYHCQVVRSGQLWNPDQRQESKTSGRR